MDLNTTGGLGNGIACALVTQSVTATAPQLLEPDADAFRADVLSILRTAIDTGGLEELLPPACQG